MLLNSSEAAYNRHALCTILMYLQWLLTLILLSEICCLLQNLLSEWWCLLQLPLSELLCLWKFFTLIPIHNVLEQPNYWYEEFICRVLSCGVIVTCQNAIRAECWSNFTFDNKFATYIWLILIGHGLGLCAYAAHFYIWTIYLSQPLALSHFMMGTALVLAINTTIYFR